MNENYHKLRGWSLMATHCKKELKTIFSDNGALLILIGAMIIYPIVYSIGYYNETMQEIPFGVVDLDRTVTSRKYINMMDASAELHITHKPNNLKQAEELFLSNEITGVLLIPKGFQKNVLAGKQTDVAVYADASYFLKYKNQFTVAANVNGYFGGGVSVLRYMAEGKSFKQAKVCANPIDIQAHVLYNPGSAYGSFIMPGVVLIIIQQTLLIGIGLLGGSFSESKASPFILPENKRKREIIPYLFGKTGAYIFITLLNIAYGVILIHHWFNYPDKANIIEVLMLLLPFALAVIFLGIGISTLFKHRESAIVFMVFMSPIALFLSGMSWPISAIPDWLVGLSKLLPSTIVLPAYLRLRTMGVGIGGVKSEILLLYLQAVVYAIFTISYFFIRIRKK